MKRQLATRARRLAAAAIGFMATAFVLTLNAATAVSRIPPDQIDAPGTDHSGGAPTITAGSPIWTYLVVAGAALVVGIVLTRAVSLLRLRMGMRTA